jgi:AhpD family alkylhydroperoxidase
MQTLDPYAVSPKEMQELISLHAFLDSSGLDESLIELLRLHVSLLNSCAEGVRRHCRRLSILRETTERLVALGAWRSASLFTEKERAALEWSEAVTFVSRSRVPDGFYAAMRQWFTDIEIVKLTMVIAATTAWNRMEMSFPRSYSEAE